MCSSDLGCGSAGANPEQPSCGPLGALASSSGPANADTEEDKAKKLLYCSLCKVAVNSLSQLEAHNKGRMSLMRTQARSITHEHTLRHTHTHKRLGMHLSEGDLAHAHAHTPS